MAESDGPTPATADTGIWDPDKFDRVVQIITEGLIDRYERGLTPPGLVVKVSNNGNTIEW